MPGHLKARIRNGELFIIDRAESEQINKSVDYFLMSLAEDKKSKAICVILSGMGTDGAVGVKEIDKNGGIVLVQDPSSTPYDAMPFAAIHSDHPDGIMTPANLGKKLVQMIK